MSKGVILFAFNSPKYNYYEMAEYAAKRINYFLHLPVTIVTDKDSIPKQPTYTFDNTILVKPDRNNFRDWGVWVNKGRHQAFKLSPYDETLLLDVDYVVNSNKLLKVFEVYDDFCCHENTTFLMHPKVPQDLLSSYSYRTLWATVIAFKKTSRAKQVFDSMEMIQSKFEHYGYIHSFISGTFRNDYALTLALRIANGHNLLKTDIIPWNLMHVGKSTQVYAETNDVANTEYVVTYDNWQRGKIRKEYMIVKDLDFHLLNKNNYLELMK